jgi:hypothetical protein
MSGLIALTARNRGREAPLDNGIYSCSSRSGEGRALEEHGEVNCCMLLSQIRSGCETEVFVKVL